MLRSGSVAGSRWLRSDALLQSTGQRLIQLDHGVLTPPSFGCDHLFWPPRSIDGDTGHIAVDLDFDTVEAATAFRDFLTTFVWGSPATCPRS